jgi:hypothetical protein
MIPSKKGTKAGPPKKKIRPTKRKKNTSFQRVMKKMESFVSGHAVFFFLVLLALSIMSLSYFDHLRKKKKMRNYNESVPENEQSSRILELINRAISERNPIDLYFMSKMYRFFEKNSSMSLFYNFQSLFNTNDIESAVEVLEEVLYDCL